MQDPGSLDSQRPESAGGWAAGGAGRAGLLAEVAGLYEGAHEGVLDEPQARPAAQLARAAGANPEAVRAGHVPAGGDPDDVLPDNWRKGYTAWRSNSQMLR